MAKFKVIPIYLYKRDITVFIGTHDEFKQWVESYKVPSSWEQLIESIVESDDNAVASYWYNNNNGNGIIELCCHPEKKEEIGIAAHECLHCAMHILSYVNIPCIPHGANEAYTYLLEYLLVRVLDYNDYELVKL